MTLFVPRQITFLTTNRCSARCAHCSMNSAPERREVLDKAQMIRILDHMDSLYGMRLAIFAGGEPTLLGDDLLDVIAHADSLGIATRLVTNGSWATSDERASRWAFELRAAALMEINISADDYHAPYVPFERVERAWRACHGLGFTSVVVANVCGPDSRVTPNVISDRLGGGISVVENDGPELAALRPSPDGTTYAIVRSSVQLLGRARQEVRAGDLTPVRTPAELEGGCPWAVRSPAISPTNHLLACCGTEAAGNEILDFGSLSTNSLDALVERANDDPFVNAIAQIGPGGLLRFLRTVEPQLDLPSGHRSVCEICEDLTSNPSVHATVRKHAVSLMSTLLNARIGNSEGKRGPVPTVEDVR